MMRGSQTVASSSAISPSRRHSHGSSAAVRHMRLSRLQQRTTLCQQKLLKQEFAIRWHQRVTNSEIQSHAGVGPLVEQSTHRRTSVSLVLARLDYGNSVLAGLPTYLVRRLQSVMNVAARLISHLWTRWPAFIGCASLRESSSRLPS